MNTADFDFSLPSELIAQVPPLQRGESRLCLFQRELAKLAMGKFWQLPWLVRQLRTQCGFSKIYFVCNDSKVFPARFNVQRPARQVGFPAVEGEVFLLNPLERGPWKCLLRPQKKMRVGELLREANTGVPLFRVESLQPPLISLIHQTGALDPAELKLVLDRHGKMPLPPYILRDSGLQVAKSEYSARDLEELDKERYQNVYASQNAAVRGSAAAPTAGLHFTKEIMDSCQNEGAEFLFVTLHVGLGTFAPVQSDKIFDHQMHAEYCYVSPEVAEKLNACKWGQQNAKSDRPAVIYVGTTALRTVESFFRFQKNGGEWFETNLFIHPLAGQPNVPVSLNLGDGILTNFHQPKSTLCMLVAALLGYDNWRSVYQTALAQSMRFLSYGDANLYLWGQQAGLASLHLDLPSQGFGENNAAKA